MMYSSHGYSFIGGNKKNKAFKDFAGGHIARFLGIMI